MPRSFRQDPQARKDYEFDWRRWLAGDTIAAHTVTAAAGLTVTSSASATAVTVWASGGVVGVAYTVTCHIETAAGRVDERTATIVISEQ